MTYKRLEEKHKIKKQGSEEAFPEKAKTDAAQRWLEANDKRPYGKNKYPYYRKKIPK